MFSLFLTDLGLQESPPHREPRVAAAERQVALLQQRKRAAAGADEQHIGLVLNRLPVAKRFDKPASGRAAVSTLDVDAVFDGHAQVAHEMRRDLAG